MNAILAIAAAYLLGCSNLAFYISKLRKVEFRGKGSGNLGASNATILLGWYAGVAVALHDIGKAVAAVYLAKWLCPGSQAVAAAAGVASVLGHIFPFYLKFKGGKGFASYFGVTLALNWKLALAVAAVCIVITVVTDFIVFATVTTVTMVPISLGFLTGDIFLVLILYVATGVILYKHRENFRKLREGKELGLLSAFKGENRVS